MKISKIVMNDKHPGLEIETGNQWYRLFKQKEEVSNIGVTTFHLITKTSGTMVVVGWPKIKGDFWSHKGKNYYLRFSKKGFTIGKLAVKFEHTKTQQ